VYTFECADCSITIEKQTTHTSRDGEHRCKRCAQNKADKKHYLKNRTARIKNAADWNKENKDRRKVTTRLYLESEHGKTVVNENQKRRYWLNPEYRRLKNRARLHGISVVELIGLKDNTCQLCGGSKNITIDHMHPQNHGGKSSIDNLQPLCFRCNVWKSDNLFLTDGGGYLVGESYGG
jgi:5-methylcytosine-specific restriction endonuclease McrA